MCRISHRAWYLHGKGARSHSPVEWIRLEVVVGIKVSLDLNPVADQIILEGCQLILDWQRLHIVHGLNSYSGAHSISPCFVQKRLYLLFLQRWNSLLQ